MRHRDDWRPRIQGTNEEFSFCDENTTLLSLCLSISFCHEREMDNYIPSGKSFAVVSLDHLFLVVIFWMTMLFLTPRFEKTRETHHRGRMKTRVFLSVCLSVSLSLSLARVVAKKSKRHATKKRRLRVVVSQPLKKKQSHQIRSLSFETTRKEEEEDTRERVLSLLRAVLRVKEIERCDFWFLPFVFVRLCLRVVSGERERESPMMMV